VVEGDDVVVGDDREYGHVMRANSSTAMAGPARPMSVTLR
jgi:hypothetical protein